MICSECKYWYEEGRIEICCINPLVVIRDGKLPICRDGKLLIKEYKPTMKDTCTRQNLGSFDITICKECPYLTACNVSRESRQ